MTKLRWIGLTQWLLAAILLAGIWLALPARWAWVDVPGTLIGVACLAIGFGLVRQQLWAARAARYLLWAELVLGTLTVSLLALSAAQLAGSYGPVGAGGALLLGTVALLVLPYLVVFPVLLLRWLSAANA